MDTGFVIVISAVIGAAFGALIMHVGLPRVTRDKEAKAAREELNEYREQVAEHFAQTAKLVNNMTDSYKSVFEHLQDGARALLSEETIRDRLTADSDEVITLQRLGARGSEDPVTEARASEEAQDAPSTPADEAREDDPAPAEGSEEEEKSASPTADDEPKAASEETESDPEQPKDEDAEKAADGDEEADSVSPKSAKDVEPSNDADLALDDRLRRSQE